MFDLLDAAPPVRELRPYQTEAIDMLRESLRTGHKRPVLQLPTGGGKTAIAGAIIRMALEKGNRVTFTVPAISLVDQTKQSFWRDGIREIGVIQADHPETDWDAPVQVASVQTLARRGFPDCGLVIIDEVHRWFKVYEHWMTTRPDLRFVCLSATPWTRGLGKWCDDLIVCATTEQMIEAGWLCDFRAFSPGEPDLSGVRTVAGDYHEGDLSKAMDKDILVGDIVDQWIKLGEGRQTLCYGVDCAHARHIQERFNAAGIPCGYQDANTLENDRKAIKRDFENGDLRIVSNVGTLTTGVDWDVRCIILARPTKSEMLYCQIIGRGLRTAGGKDNLIIIDHSTTSDKLGLVTDIHHEHLDDGKPRKKAAGSDKEDKTRLPKKCQSCSALRPAGVRKCQNCGFEPQLQTDISAIDGELVEKSRSGKSKQVDLPGFISMHGQMIPHRQFYAELLGYAFEKKYAKGWANHKYREKVGEWPNFHSVTPTTPSYEVETWIRSRIIAWAKRKAKEAKGEDRAHA